ncbi:hypothetical protein [Moraxella marmotae]|uniref:hypothetical protein n=1 Tax=Moraxella marmotae TaxID=3344520 RepID=UPI0035F4973E
MLINNSYYKKNTQLYVFLGLALLGAVYSLYTYVPGCLLMDEFYEDMNNITQTLGQPVSIYPIKRCQGPTVLEYEFEGISNKQYQNVVDNLRSSEKWQEVSIGSHLTDMQHFCKEKVALHIYPGGDSNHLDFVLRWNPSDYCYKNH